MNHGCHNRAPILPGYWHTSRQLVDGIAVDVTRWVPHAMTTECQTRGQYPPLAQGCEGCRWMNNNGDQQ